MCSFITKANIIHNNKYNYDNVVYGKNAHEKVIIICSDHGEFMQSPTHHLNGKGCASCASCAHVISKPEIEWLNYLNISQDYRKQILKIQNKILKPDAYDPTTNTIYEFYGDFWHGNPKIYSSQDMNKAVKKTYGELYVNTIKRENMIKEAGFKLITIWESDWTKNE